MINTNVIVLHNIQIYLLIFDFDNVPVNLYLVSAS